MWDAFLSNSDTDYERAVDQYEIRLNAYHADSENPDRGEPPDVPRPRMQKDEVKNFLRLSTALKLLLAPSITDASIDRASKLYEDYVLELEHVSLITY